MNGALPSPPQHAKLLVLAGPTAVGKTAQAIAWARALGGEIINADSRQLYRAMDIGTAKPTPAEQAAAPHHLLDVVDPDETFTLAQYQAAAYAAIQDVQARGALPILTGGTGMYITAVLEGWQVPEIPPDPALRAELEAQTNAELFARLQDLDPITAQRIDPQNPRRLVRAVEVSLLSGRPFSELRRKNPPPYDVYPVALYMEPRSALYARAEQRLQDWLARGWLDEVRALLAAGYDPASPAMTALGYPQMVAHVRGELALDTAREIIAKATRGYIRRQLTWLRGHDPGWQWHTPEAAPGLTETLGAWFA